MALPSRKSFIFIKFADASSISCAKKERTDRFAGGPFSLFAGMGITDTGMEVRYLLGLDSDTFYIYHVAAVMVDNLRRLLLGINLSDKAIMDFDFPGVGFPV